MTCELKRYVRLDVRLAAACGRRGRTSSRAPRCWREEVGWPLPRKCGRLSHDGSPRCRVTGAVKDHRIIVRDIFHVASFFHPSQGRDSGRLENHSFIFFLFFLQIFTNLHAENSNFKPSRGKSCFFPVGARRHWWPQFKLSLLTTSQTMLFWQVKIKIK